MEEGGFGFGYELDDFLSPGERQEDVEEETSLIDLPEPPILEPSDGQTLQDYADRIGQLSDDIGADQLRAWRDR